MNTEYTKYHGIELPKFGERPSPTLIYHKWHAYDHFFGNKAFETKDSRRTYLNKIAIYVKISNRNYANWYNRYIAALRFLKARNTDASFPTVWRFATGLSTNPALETGIFLHHLYGFPCIPGSTIKGSIHHCAEMSIVNANWKPPGKKDEKPTDKAVASLEEAIEKAKLVRALFGSVFLEPPDPGDHDQATPLAWFKRWLERIDLPGCETVKRFAPDLSLLVSDQHTGGMLCFYDAVPDPASMNEKEILQVDIINPHYPAYYNDESHKTPPSDDQSPKPVYFLAVRPNARFVFPYKLKPFPMAKARDDCEKERLQALKPFKKEEIEKLIDDWIREALSMRGIGAKTSSGYGYFNVP